MKVKYVAIFTLIAIIVTVIVIMFTGPRTITRMPNKIIEKPELLFELAGDNQDFLKQPMGVTVDDNGKIYVADTGNQQIKIFSDTGVYISSFGQKGTQPGGLAYPYGIVTLKNGHLLVADSGNLNVQEFDQDGKYIKTWFDKKENIKPGAMTVDNNGQIYISDLSNHQIILVDQQGKLVRKLSSKPEGMLYPQGIAVDKNGHIWVADAGHDQFIELDSNGQIQKKIIGIDKGSPFAMVRGVAIDNLGRIYFSDTLNNRVTVFGAKGNMLYNVSGDFSYPMSIYISRAGKIFIVNRGSGIIQVWGYNS